MKRIQMPSSYAVVTEEEKELLGGGGAFRDAWDSFTDHLRLNDFFFRGGLLSLSISFIPMLLFNVVKAGFHVAENVHTFLFGKLTCGSRWTYLESNNNSIRSSC